MADTPTPTREKSIKSKIVPGKDLGNPKAAALLETMGSAIIMGEVLGYVEKMITRTMPTGQVYEGFGGFFRAIPTDSKLPIVESGICYFPAGFHELIEGPFKAAEADAKANDRPTPRMNFKFKVEAVKDGNAQGYAWRYTPLLAAMEADPLAHLMNASAPQAQIAAQPQTPATLAADTASAKEPAPAAKRK